MKIERWNIGAGGKGPGPGLCTICGAEGNGGHGGLCPNMGREPGDYLTWEQARAASGE